MGVLKGYKHSVEARRNMSLAQKGNQKFLGHKHSDKTRRKMSLSHKGLKHSAETKAKISLAKKGHRVSLETRQKIGLAHKGKSYPHSEESKRKMSLAMKRCWRIPEIRRRMTIPHKGKKHSAETIRKILTRRIPSSLEEEFQAIIDKYQLPYKYTGNGSFFVGRYNPDFVNVDGEKIAIEVYARFYKLRSFKNIARWKAARKKTFKKYGWEIIFFDETEVREKGVLEKLRRRKT